MPRFRSRHTYCISVQRGAIGPHVDNVDASGSIIMGVSLGAPRVLRMVQRAFRPVSGSGMTGRHSDASSPGLEGEPGTAVDHAGSKAAFEVLLAPGSVYIQRLVHGLSALPLSHWCLGSEAFSSGMQYDMSLITRSQWRTRFEEPACPLVRD